MIIIIKNNFNMVSKVGGPPGSHPPGSSNKEEDSAIYSQLKKFINVIVSHLLISSVHGTVNAKTGFCKARHDQRYMRGIISRLECSREFHVRSLQYLSDEERFIQDNYV